MTQTPTNPPSLTELVNIRNRFERGYRCDSDSAALFRHIDSLAATLAERDKHLTAMSDDSQKAWEILQQVHQDEGLDLQQTANAVCRAVELNEKQRDRMIAENNTLRTRLAAVERAAEPLRAYLEATDRQTAGDADHIERLGYGSGPHITVGEARAFVAAFSKTPTPPAAEPGEQSGEAKGEAIKFRCPRCGFHSRTIRPNGVSVCNMRDCQWAGSWPLDRWQAGLAKCVGQAAKTQGVG